MLQRPGQPSTRTMYYLELVAVTSYIGMQLVVFTGINVVTANAIGYSQANSVYLYLVARAR